MLTRAQFQRKYKFKTQKDLNTAYGKYRDAQVTINQSKGVKRTPLDLGAGSLNRFDLFEDPRGRGESALGPVKTNLTGYGLRDHSYLEIVSTDSQGVKRMPFWATGVGYGVGSTGETAQSKLFKAYYPHSLNETPITVTGRVPTEEYYADFSEWVRSSQLIVSTGGGMVRLYIPAAGINSIGFIASIGVEYNSGFEPAPEISFDFIIQDRDGSRSGNSEISSMVIAYFLNPSDHYWGKKAREFSDEIYRDLEDGIVRSLNRQITNVDRIKKQREKAAREEARRKAQAKRDRQSRGGG